MLSVDGAIHPARYEGRVIKDTNKPLMTTTYLHLLAKRHELRSGDDDYIEKIMGLVAYFYAAKVAGSMIRKNSKIK